MHNQTEQGGSSLDSSAIDVAPVPQRVREIAMLRGLGYSFREIGSQLQVSPQAVSLMLSRHRRFMGALRDARELTHLSARAVNALGRHGIHTRKEAIRRNALDLLKSARNCGRKTLEEISAWIGQRSDSTDRIPVPPAPAQVRRHPRKCGRKTEAALGPRT
jgi:hypothetical protein